MTFLKRTGLLVTLSICAGSLTAAPLVESMFTEVIKDVNVVSATTTPARVNELFKVPDRVRTGPESRAELTAPDKTITRVGANTVFAFESDGRNIRLDQGNILFHSPAGKGGGTIKTGGASAAVLGTTLIVSSTVDGGFKVILLEGKGKVTPAKGKSVMLKAGQMVFVLPGTGKLGRVLDINLDKLVAGSQLVNGFSHELSSAPLVQAAIEKQKSGIASGNVKDTGIPADRFVKEPVPTDTSTQVDHAAFQTAAHAPLQPEQFEVILLNQGKGAGGQTLTPLGF